MNGNDKDGIIIRHILDSLAPWKRSLREVSALPPSAESAGETEKTAAIREIAGSGTGYEWAIANLREADTESAFFEGRGAGGKPRWPYAPPA